MGKTKRKKKKCFLFRLIKKLIVFALIVLILLAGYIYITLPEIDKYGYNEPTSSEILAENGTVIGEISSKNVTYSEIDEISPNLVNAVISIEDRRFSSHFGIDLIGIARASIANLKAGEIVQGGSTITQQVAELLYYEPSHSYIKKAIEAITAIKLDIVYSKDEIMTMYLNEIYLGGGAYGVKQASMLYFDKEPMDLSIAECAVLAGIIQAPSAYCPLDEEGYGYAMQRKEKVLLAMLDEQHISQEEYDEAISEEIIISSSSNASYFSHGVSKSGYEGFNSYVFDEAVEIIADYYMQTFSYNEKKAIMTAESDLYTKNLVIQTTLNENLQSLTVENSRYAVSDYPDLSVAFVSINSIDGGIESYYGGDYSVDTVRNPRQPASSIKPLYISYLIENGIIDSGSYVLDEATEINGYAPNNFANKYYGNSTVREVLVESMNIGALKFFDMGNMDDQIDFIKSMGVSTIVPEDYNLSFALGGLYNGISPLEMAGAYSIIDNGGVKNDIHAVVSISDEQGTVITPAYDEPQRVMSEETANIMYSFLQSVVTRGTGAPADTGYDTIGKTGTSDEERDLWFIGATSKITSAVWVGDTDGGTTGGLGSYICSGLYSDVMLSAIDNYYINTDYLNSKSYDEIEYIYVVDEEAQFDINKTKPLDSSSLIELKIVAEDKPNFKNQAIKVEVDSLSDMLFNYENCPEENLEVRYYLLGYEPTDICDVVHIFNQPLDESIQDFFDKF